VNATDAGDAGDATAIFCPECGDEVEDLAPENYLVPGVRPGRRHVSVRLTEAERAERVEALTAELAAAVAALTDSVGWRSMLEVSARFRRYFLNDQLLLWARR
jgi:hypothetical protein